MEPTNQSLWTLLRTVQEAANVDKKERYEIAAKERAQEEARIRAKDLARANATAAAAAAHTTPVISASTAPANVVNEDAAFNEFFSDIDKPAATKSTSLPNDSSAEDDVLAAFLSSVSAAPSEPVASVSSNNKSSTGIVGMDRQNGNLINEKYSSQDLGTAEEKADRLLQTNYQWKNLNPFYVLQLGIDATEEDIKQRYRKLSTRVHPDKLRDRENAREAFEEVR